MMVMPNLVLWLDSIGCQTRSLKNEKKWKIEKKLNRKIVFNVNIQVQTNFVSSFYKQMLGGVIACHQKLDTTKNWNVKVGF